MPVFQYFLDNIKKFKKYHIMFFIYDVFIFLPICIVSFLERSTDSYNNVLMITLAFILLLPAFASILGFNKNPNKEPFIKKWETDAFLSNIYIDNIRYENEKYKLVFPSRISVYLNSIFPHFSAFRIDSINHSTNIEDIKNKQQDKTSIEDKMAKENYEKMISIIKRVNNVKILGSFIFIIPFIIFIALNIICAISGRKDSCSVPGSVSGQGGDGGAEEGEGGGGESGGGDSSSQKVQNDNTPQDNEKKRRVRAGIFFLCMIVSNFIIILVYIFKNDMVIDVFDKAESTGMGEISVCNKSTDAFMANKLDVCIIVFKFLLFGLPMLIEDIHTMYETKDPTDVINEMANPLVLPDISNVLINKSIINNIKKYRPTKWFENWVTGTSYDIEFVEDSKHVNNLLFTSSSSDNNPKNKLQANSDFKDKLIDYKLYILKQSLFYKIYDIYIGKDLFSSLNVLSKILLYKKTKQSNEKDKLTLKTLGKLGYILVKIVIIICMVITIFESKNPNDFMKLSFQILLGYVILYGVLNIKNIYTSIIEGSKLI